MNTWTTAAIESEMVRVLGEIVILKTHSPSDRSLLSADVQNLQQEYDHTGTLAQSPEFKYWEGRALAVRGAWWECPEGSTSFTVHF